MFEDQYTRAFRSFSRPPRLSRKWAWKLLFQENRLGNCPRCRENLLGNVFFEKIDLEVLPDVEKSLGNSRRCRENRLGNSPRYRENRLGNYFFEKIDLEIVPVRRKSAWEMIFSRRSAWKFSPMSRKSAWKFSPLSRKSACKFVRGYIRSMCVSFACFLTKPGEYNMPVWMDLSLNTK